MGEIPGIPPEEMMSDDERADFQKENKEALENFRMYIDTMAGRTGYDRYFNSRFREFEDQEIFTRLEEEHGRDAEAADKELKEKTKFMSGLIKNKFELLKPEEKSGLSFIESDVNEEDVAKIVLAKDAKDGSYALRTLSPVKNENGVSFIESEEWMFKIDNEYGYYTRMRARVDDLGNPTGPVLAISDGAAESDDLDRAKVFFEKAESNLRSAQ